MLLDYAMDDRQTESSAALIGGLFSAVEGFEDLRERFARDAAACVADHQSNVVAGFYHLVAGVGLVELDAVGLDADRAWAIDRLDGISKQVLDGPRELILCALDG